jgi:MoxR-like ATPase
MGTYLEINFMEAIWQFLTSRGAIYFYIIFILLSVVVIVVLVMRNEVRRQALMENNHVQTVAKPVSEAEPLSDEPRFFMLTQIDREVEAGKRHFYEDDVSLQKLCEEFREFSASRLGLYYDIADVRRFIGGLAVSHIMILQGMSGTGKTSLAYAFGEYLDNSAVIVPIQPMWKERTDLIGYYNEFTRKFNETTLLQKLYEANTNDNIYITVLDEMNIARVEYYFAEFLSLLEIPDYRKRYLDVVADIWDTDPKLLKNGQLLLPTNMWFVGTANNDDSTFAISDKVYDRAMNLDRKAKPFIASETNTRRISAGRFRMLIKEAQKKYALSQRNLRRIRQLDRYLIEHFQITFGNRIMQQIRNYVPVIVACGGSELSAIDDILAKKVLRKLEAKNLVYVRSAAPGLVAYLDELFGEDRMALCKEYVHNIEKNV